MADLLGDFFSDVQDDLAAVTDDAIQAETTDAAKRGTKRGRDDEIAEAAKKTTTTISKPPTKSGEKVIKKIFAGPSSGPTIIRSLTPPPPPPVPVPAPQHAGPTYNMSEIAAMGAAGKLRSEDEERIDEKQS